MGGSRRGGAQRACAPSKACNDRQKWSDRVSFVGLAGYIPKCTKTCIAQNRVCNVQKSLAVGAPTQISLGELTTLLNWLGRG